LRSRRIPLKKRGKFALKGPEMAGKKQILLTAAEVKGWREEKRDIEQKMAALQKRLDAVMRKLNAAEVLAPEAVAETKSGRSLNGSSRADEDSGEAETSIAKVFLANMAVTGDSLKVAQIRTRLAELGFQQKVASHPNYAYGLVHRLTRMGYLIKRGPRYRAAPKGSSQEETGTISGPGPAASNQV
jgi:hypothetical protein